MDQEKLRQHLRSLLQEIEEGKRLDRSVVRGGMGAFLGRPPSDEEIEATITQLKSISLVLSLDERVNRVIEYLQSSADSADFLQPLKEMVDQLFSCVEKGQEIPAAVRLAFGVVGPFHEQVMRSAIRNGTITYQQALSAVHDGVAITKLLESECTIEIPITFRSVDGNGMPQTFREYDRVQFQQPEKVTVGDESFEILISNESELRQLAHPEEDMLGWMRSTFNENSVFYDIGANIGYYSLYAAMLGSDVKVVSFEPATLNVARMNMNIFLNRLDSRIRLYPVALSDITGPIRFGNGFFIPGGWSHPGVEERSERINEQTFYTGSIAYRLDDFIDQTNDLPKPTHLKIDVDGPELAVLRGAQQSLGIDSLKYLVVEMRSNKEVEMAISLLEPFGFSLQNPQQNGFGNRYFER